MSEYSGRRRVTGEAQSGAVRTLSGLVVLILISLSLAAIYFPSPYVPKVDAAQAPFSIPVGPLSPPPTFTTTAPQLLNFTEEDSHYCPTCKSYPNLFGVLNDFYEAKVQPNGGGTTWYLHFPTTNGISVNGLTTVQSLDPTGTILTISLLNTKN